VQGKGGPITVVLKEDRELVGAFFKDEIDRRGLPARTIDKAAHQAIGIALRHAASQPHLVKVARQTASIPDEVSGGITL
jgi:hypothetical protein